MGTSEALSQEQISNSVEKAKSLAYVRPLERVPGWRHGFGENSPDPAVQARLEVWKLFNRERLQVPVPWTWWDGLRLELYLGNDASRCLFVGGCLDPNEFAFLDGFLQPGMVVIDAGANEGLYSMFAARRVGPEGTVWAFEPSSRELERFSKNIALNGLANIRLDRSALSDGDGELPLQLGGFEHENKNTLGRFVHSGVEGGGSEVVAARRLDTLFADSGLGRLDLLKMDVEGAEVRLLEGARETLAKHRPVILFEALEAALQAQGSSRQQLWDLLRASGYTLYVFDASGRPALFLGRYASENMLAVPRERPLPVEWCGPLHLPAGEETSSDGNAPEPRVSIVVTTRNDDHGGDLLRRTQTFVNALIGQCQRHRLAAELIVVEWNPPADRAPLHEALYWPADSSPCRVRFIEVPHAIQERYKHPDALPLLQMIGKNVGIRRARGKFVLATNIDILFSDELMRFLASGELDARRMYRIDRHDVMPGVPMDGDVAERLAYCESHMLRVNAREGTIPLHPGGELRAAEFDVIERNAGISLGSGWTIPEVEDGEPARWGGFDAEVTIEAQSGPARLVLEVEPGPGVEWQPFVLTAFDENDRALASCTVAKRSEIQLELGGGSTRRTIRLRCEAGGIPSKNDLRILNFRVFRMGRSGAAAAPSAAQNAAPPTRKGFFGKILGILRRAAENGPVITVWVPVPGVVRRFLRIWFRTPAAPVPQNPVSSTEEPVPVLEVSPAVKFLHTNACGDFTLLAKEQWLALRAYPEWDLYSFHIDSIFCYTAHHAGIYEVVLPPPMKIYHIEHGSGWSPESAGKLFRRLKDSGVSWLGFQDLTSMVYQMRRLDCPMIFNGEEWGLGDHELPETVLAPPQLTCPELR